MVGCGPTWDAKRALPTALALNEIQQLDVKVCRNDWCFATSLADFRPTEPFMANAGLGLALPSVAANDPSVAVTFWGTAAGKAGEVQVTWSFGPPGAAGDVFSFELVRRDGTSLLRVVEAANYEVYYPNGADCPPRCERVASRS